MISRGPGRRVPTQSDLPGAAHRGQSGWSRRRRRRRNGRDDETHNIRAETDADDKVITHRYLGTDKCKDDLLAFPGAELGTVTLTARNVQRDSEGHISRYII